MLFLHGGGLNVHTWDLVCSSLKLERHCLALDQRGHGDSEWSPEMDYGFETHAADVEALARGLDAHALPHTQRPGFQPLASSPSSGRISRS